MSGFPIRQELPFPGTEEELDGWLGEYARHFGARFVKRGDFRRLSQGDLLSTHPSSSPWHAGIRKEGAVLHIVADAPGSPWARRRMGRLVEARVNQLTDYLQTRLRGETGDACTGSAQTDPFQPIGPGIRGCCMALAGWSLQTAGALFLALLVALLPGFILVSQSRERIEARTEVAARLGALSLPSTEELAARSFLDDLGAAFLLVFPFAFLIGLSISLSHLLNDLSKRLSRLPLLTFMFFLLLLLFSFWDVLPFWGAVPFALLIPAAAQAGVTLVWSWRRERRRQPRASAPRPFAPSRGLVVLFMAMMLGLVLATLVLHPSSGKALVGFRDRYLLTGAPGRGIVDFYYRHTLYAADPIKPVDPVHEIGALRTVLVVGSEADAFSSAWLVDRVSPEEALLCLERYRYDLYVVPDVPRLLTEIGEFGSASRILVLGGSPADLAVRFSEMAASAFDAERLNGLSHLGWQSIRLAGPLVFIFMMGGFLALPIGLILRKLPPRAPLIVVPLFFVMTLIVLVAALPRFPEDVRTSLRLIGSRDENSFKVAVRELNHPLSLVRGEALSRLLEDPGLAAALPAEYLVPAVGDSAPLVRARACTLLGHLTDPGAVPLLQRGLEDSSWFVRYHAARALRRPDAAPARARLVELVKTDRWYVGACALDALRHIPPQAP